MARMRLIHAVYCIHASVLVAGGAVVVSQVHWNTTPSVPTGLYVDDANGNMARFCPSGDAAVVSKERGYRPSSYLSECADGGWPLLKRIVAVKGDVVEMSAWGISVNGRLLRNTAPSDRDSQGRELKAWETGRYEVGEEVWVAGDHPRSFDSRYFGPVPVSRMTRMRKF